MLSAALLAVLEAECILLVLLLVPGAAVLVLQSLDEPLSRLQTAIHDLSGVALFAVQSAPFLQNGPARARLVRRRSVRPHLLLFGHAVPFGICRRLPLCPRAGGSIGDEELGNVRSVLSHRDRLHSDRGVRR